MLRSTRTQLFLLANGAGIAALVIYGSRFRVDRRVTFVPGEELGKYFGWELFGILLFLIVIAASVAGFVIALRKPDAASRKRGLLLTGMFFVCWIAAIKFDAAGRFLD